MLFTHSAKESLLGCASDILGIPVMGGSDECMAEACQW